MLLISHRGNIFGRDERRENHPDYIIKALDEGFDVEIDVWYISDILFLGHDSPEYPIDKLFISDPRMWIHCKNLAVMEYLSEDLSLNMFAHWDGIVFTTQGFLWTAPGEKLTPRSIAAMPELIKGWDISKAYGICTDYPLKYKRWT